MTQLID